MVNPCSKGSWRSLCISFGSFGGSTVFDNPLKPQHAWGDCPQNSPKATARIKVIERRTNNFIHKKKRTNNHWFTMILKV